MSAAIHLEFNGKSVRAACRTPAKTIEPAGAHLPQDLFPGGDKAGWWFKCVQIDLEERGILDNAAWPLVRLRQTSGKE